MSEHEEFVLRFTIVIALAVILALSVIGLTVVAIATDRDLFRAELLTFGGVSLLAAIGGVSWWQLRRRRWRLNIERNGSPPPTRPRRRELEILPDDDEDS